MIEVDDPDGIAEWSRHALLNGLYRWDGVAQDLFRGGTRQGRIVRMVVEPGIAWGIVVVSPRGGRHLQAFTREEHRRRGWGGRIWNRLKELEGWT